MTPDVRVSGAMIPDPRNPERLLLALASLRGLALGDALGSQFFVPANYPALQSGALPPGVWQWTDDTEMACSVVAVLHAHGSIDQDDLAASFAQRHDFDRGYGPAVNRMLRLIRQEGADWRTLAAQMFNGQGSWGNGAAMRVAPLGAWYAGEPEKAAEQAELSAYTTQSPQRWSPERTARRSPRRCWTGSSRSFRAAPCKPGCVAPATCSTTRMWQPSPRCSAAVGAPVPMTPCRSRCGWRPGGSVTTRERSGPRRGPAAMSTPRAR
jgi:hypothetical protein